MEQSVQSANTNGETPYYDNEHDDTMAQPTICEMRALAPTRSFQQLYNSKPPDQLPQLQPQCATQHGVMWANQAHRVLLNEISAQGHIILLAVDLYDNRAHGASRTHAPRGP